MSKLAAADLTVAATGRLELLERQMQQGWNRLRFDPGLEGDFLVQHRIWALPFRLTLIVIAAILLAITPALDHWLLHPPQAFAVPVHRVQVGIMLPVLLLAGACAYYPRLARWADATALLAVAVVIGGLLYQRALGAQHGVWVPTELITATLAGGYVMGGLGFWRTTAAAVVVLLATALCEIVSYGNGATTQYIIFGVSVQFLIAGLAGFLQEHFARGTWLRSEMLAILATLDSLTGLLNFRAFEQRYQRLFARAGHEGKPVLIALLDLDCFKQYNDAYGHAAGNVCLRRIGAELARMFPREHDIAARMGGEEFALVVYDADRTTAQRLLDDLRRSIESLAIPHQNSPLPGRVVTLSIGALWWSPTSQLGADAALQEADRSLYVAKGVGRNAVVFSDEPRAAAGLPPANDSVGREQAPSYRDV